MGDRANIKFKQSEGPIYLYGHWSGKNLAVKAKHALKLAQARWGDESYGTKIVVANMFDLLGAINSTTGFGLSVGRQDNERDILEIDFTSQKVRVLDKDSWRDGKELMPRVEMTFSEFCELDDNYIMEMIR